MTAEQIRAALQNHHRQPRTRGAKIRDAMQHAQLSKQKPANLAGTRGPVNTENNRRPHYGSEST
jgi:hypothetical protein